jgi:hypothetical protein
MIGCMQITARLDESTVKDLLGQLLPVTVVIDDEGDDRWLRIDPARSVDFAAGEGLRVEVSGQLHWKAAGIPVLITINSAQLLLTPLVLEDDGERRLIFRPSLEKMDMKNIPDFLDSGIASIVNKRLEGRGESLSWHFGRSFDAHVPLGKELSGVESFNLGAGSATVEVTTDAVVLTLVLTMGFARAPDQPLPE